MWLIAILVVLPLLKAVLEVVYVVDELSFEEVVELFGADLVGYLHLVVEAGVVSLMWTCPRKLYCIRGRVSSCQSLVFLIIAPTCASGMLISTLTWGS